MASANYFVPNSLFCSLRREKHTVDFVICAPVVGEVRGEGRGGGQISSASHRFSTASAASDDAESIQRSPRRVPKQERRVMVESFVNKYRALNAGKFPTVSAAQREVGGSYYIIRDILQELEYNFVHKQEFSRGEELSCSDSKADRRTERHLVEVEKVSDAKEEEDKDESCTTSSSLQAEGSSTMPCTGEPDLVSGKDAKSSQGFAKPTISTSKLTDDQKSPTYDGLREEGREEPDLVNEKDAQSSQGFVKPTISTSKLTDDQKSPTYDGLREEGKEKPDLVNEKDAQSSQGFVKPTISTSKLTDDQKSPTYDGLRKTSRESASDDDLQDKPSLWSNLKSFADSVFGIWRNR